MKHLLSFFQPIILASQSPRRQEILTNLSIPFEVYLGNVSVQKFPDLPPWEYVVNLAEQKAIEPASHYTHGLIITADTIVYCKKEIMEKPKDRDDAVRMITILQGAKHHVYTGICLTDSTSGLKKSAVAVSEVSFSVMTEEEVNWYVDTREYRDKAGGYAIQGIASQFIIGINGCYFNVVGFPVNTFYRLMKEFKKTLEIEING